MSALASHLHDDGLDLAIAKIDLGHAQDTIHHARTALEGLAAELERLGLYQLADQATRAYSRLRDADPFVSLAADGDPDQIPGAAWG